MKKVYINPCVQMHTVEIQTVMTGQSNVQNSGQTTSSMGGGKVVGDAKERDEDYESNAWTDGGLW